MVILLRAMIIRHFRNEKKSKVNHISGSLVEPLLLTIWLLVFRFVPINGPINDCEMRLAADFFSFLKW